MVHYDYIVGSLDFSKQGLEAFGIPLDGVKLQDRGPSSVTFRHQRDRRIVGRHDFASKVARFGSD